MRSNFVYFFNPTTNCRTLFYDLASTFFLPYNLQFDGAADKIQIDSETVTNKDQSWRTTLSLPLKSNKLKLSYTLSDDTQEEFLKITNSINRSNDIFTHIFSTEYMLTDQWHISFAQSFTDIVNIVGSNKDLDHSTKTGLTTSYFRDFNQFKYQLNYEKSHNRNQFSHITSWTSMWNYLQYTYNGEVIHTPDLQKILSMKQLLDLNWINYNISLRPSLHLYYQTKNTENQKWQKQQFSGKLAYEFNWGRNVFIEAGNIRNSDLVDTSKTYNAFFLKVGAEYTF